MKASSKMLKFIRGKGQQPSAERVRLQRELFAFRKTVQHGFPHKPSAMAWDPLLRLLALGTTTGALRLLGKPGVEYSGQHSNPECSVTHLHFIPGTGKFLCVLSDNSLHLWETCEGGLVCSHTLALEGKLKRIWSLCIEASGVHALLGTEGGNIYLLNLNTFTIAEDIIYQDVVMQNCPEDYKLNPGAVECMAEHPTKPEHILIGYSKGLLVVWDRKASRATNTYMCNQQLESICWHQDGNEFTSSHNDGSYMTWQLNISDKPFRDPVTLYGPFPCKPVTKLMQRTHVDSGDNITIFAGGMPRANYGEKHTVTVVQGDKHVCFDFTSKVIDFITTTPVPDDVHSEDDDDSRVRPVTPEELLPQTLQQPASAVIVLLEEEIVAIDLTHPNWSLLRLPYLVSLHASSLTCTHLVSNVCQEVYDGILKAGKIQTEKLYSDAPWPVSGGSLLCAKPADPDGPALYQVLITGHEDGSVSFWDAKEVTLTPLLKVTTANLFSGDDLDDSPVESPLSGDVEEEEEWPPFRKAGIFDPFSDDPRLGVKKVALCPLTGALVIAGTAGQIVICSLSTESVTKDIKHVSVNIVSERDSFVWKGHGHLSLRLSSISLAPGFQADGVLQVLPPAAITWVSLQAEWGLLAAGTAHGLALFDYKGNVSVMHRCTLNPNDPTGVGDAPISRRKSFKKSLRESFRRLRKGRSQRRANNAEGDKKEQPKRPIPESGDSVSPLDAKPIERQVEARPVDDSNGSMVRCLHFARTFLINVQNTVPTLWAGTNNGTVYVFTINVPSGAKRLQDPVTCQLAKEIQLKHRAPVIGISVLDGSSTPLPDPLEVERGVSPLPDSTQPHRVIIASEEQFKIFTLPSLKPYCKYKLTAHEGARVRRMAFANFSCNWTDTANNKIVPHTECCLLCLTNLGDCLVLSVPDLRRQLNAAAVRREDINGISTLTFSKNGEALYLHSSSELQRITLSATHIVGARCYLTYSPWARPIATPVSIDEGMVNGDHKLSDIPEGADESGHNVTASSQSIGDITVDSVKDHLIQAVKNSGSTPEQLANKIGTINLQSSSVNQSSVIVKTTTLTTLNNSGGTTEAGTTTTSHHLSSNSTDNVLEHSREEGQITRVETSTVTVPAGTDPKTILEMFERNRSPLTVPIGSSDDNQVETETITVTQSSH